MDHSDVQHNGERESRATPNEDAVPQPTLSHDAAAAQQKVVNACLKLLSGSTDESVFAGLLLLTKHVKSEGFGAFRNTIFQAMHGKTFLLRLLQSTSEHRDQYVSLSLSLLSFFAQDPIIAKQKLCDFIPLLVQHIVRLTNIQHEERDTIDQVRDALQTIWAICVPDESPSVKVIDRIKCCVDRGLVHSLIMVSAGNALAAETENETQHCAKFETELRKRLSIEAAGCSWPENVRHLAMKLFLLFVQLLPSEVAHTATDCESALLSIHYAKAPFECERIVSFLVMKLCELKSSNVQITCTIPLPELSNAQLFAHVVCISAASVLTSRGVDQAWRISAFQMVYEIGTCFGPQWVFSDHIQLQPSSNSSSAIPPKERFVVMLQKLISVELAVRFTELRFMVFQSALSESDISAMNKKACNETKTYVEIVTALTTCTKLLEQSLENLIGSNESNVESDFGRCWGETISTTSLSMIATSLNDAFGYIVESLLVARDVVQYSWSSAKDSDQSTEVVFDRMSRTNKRVLCSMINALGNTLVQWMADETDSDSNKFRKLAVDVLVWLMTLPHPNNKTLFDVAESSSNAVSLNDSMGGFDWNRHWPVVQLEAERSSKFRSLMSSNQIAFTRMVSYFASLVKEIVEQLKSLHPSLMPNMDKFYAFLFRAIDVGEVLKTVCSSATFKENLESQDSRDFTEIESFAALVSEFIVVVSDTSRADFPASCLAPDPRATFQKIEGLLWCVGGSFCYLFLKFSTARPLAQRQLLVKPVDLYLKAVKSRVTLDSTAELASIVEKVRLELQQLES